MNCPACAHANRPGAKFCEECAAALPRLCASCGSELRPSAKFCDECGAAAGAAAPPRSAETTDARKVVTIVFADLVGSTALHERLDPESARRFMEGYYAAMRGAVESHGGTVTQFLGDGVKAVFGIPRVAEDDAIRAVRAAVAMQAAFRALADAQRSAVGKTGLRVAVNTGEVVSNDASEIIGDPVNVAARLQEQGRDGDVVIGETTERLVSALVTLELLGSFVLKGRTEAVSAYRVVSLERPVGAAAAAFVGRKEELARILSVYDTAIEKPATALAVLLGSPGLGKSRLIEEFARRLGEGAAVIQAHCDAAGGATFAPLADALRALPDLDAVVPGSDAERTRILDGVRALLVGSPASPEETFFVVRRLLSSLAAAKPVVLVIDDVHWAEPLLLDLVEHLVQWGSGVPLLVLVGARPELREIRSTLVTPGGLVSEVVTLAGLDAGAAMRLAANVIGAADLPASVAAKVLAASEGNPLFVGELVRMLVHEGALKREGERWTAGTALAALEMPPTIHALLAARIERLRPEERIVLERAAVIGRSFSRSAVAELLSRDVADLDARLESLRRAELIERDTGWFLGEPLLRFHHVLIRDAAYRRILKGTRADLHARFAGWVEARAGDLIEHDETIGWHLEQAHQHLRELGPIDAPSRALGERAAQRLAAAGRRALARDDVPLASGLLGRALDRLDPDDAARAELALDWCEALLAAGDVAPATAALEELDRFAASDARLRAWHTCFAGQLKVLTAPSGLSEAAESVAAASRELADLGDVAGEAKAHFVHAQAFARLGKVAACEAALDRALAAARRAGDRRRANTVLAIAPLAALWGPSPVTRASGRCLDVVRVLRITQGAPAVEAVALSCQGVLEALRGRTDAARRMIASARKMVEELGITQRLLEADVFAARIDLLDGDAESAERGLRAAYEGMRELGLGIDAARAAALLARALLALDRAAEAEALTRESEQLAGDDLQAAIAWRGARAEALARRGETVEAVALASKAVEIAAATDALLDHADARLALAAALRAAGRNAEADTEERRATELWVAKGATLLAERARRASSQPAAAAVQPEARRAPARAARLRVRANRATPGGPRFEAAAASRDIAALEQLFSEPCVVVHHPTGVTYGRREQLKTWQSLFRAEHLTYRREALATLGDSLELARHHISVAGFVEQRLESAGHVEIDEIVICEDDGGGRHGRFEIFADDELGPAIARLYERHAELLPDGPERVRAQALARTAHVLLGQPDVAATAAVLAPDVEFSDLRTVGFGTLRGAEAVLQTIADMMRLSRDDSAQIDDVLVLEPDALVVRWTNRGTHVESGGAFERSLCQLFAFDSAGLLSRWQQFEVEHDAEALGRFDELTSRRATPVPSARRVIPNAASAVMARFEVAFASRDAETLDSLYAETATVVDHPNGASYGREGEIESIRSLLRARETRWSHTPLATLGGALSLHNRSISARGTSGGRFDVADYEVDHVVVIEVDERGRYFHVDVLNPEHLGDAVARLYDRYAELVAEGPDRSVAAVTARSLAAVLGDPDIERIASAIAPNVQTIDHRLLGYAKALGTKNVLRAIRVMVATADDIRPRIDDVLALQPRALVVRRTVSGLNRASGGRYEKAMLSLHVCGGDGLVQHWEQFDPEREAEALARFDALLGRSDAADPLEPLANAAWRSFQAYSRAWIARDWTTVAENFSPAMRMDDRRRMVRLQIGADDFLAQLRMLFNLPGGRWEQSLLATRGDRLALSRGLFHAEVDAGGGPLEFAESLSVYETGADGRTVALVVFDPEDSEAAYAELDARFDAGEGMAHAGTLATWRRGEHAIATRDWDAVRAMVSPGYVLRDHRLLGWGTPTRETAKKVMKSLVDLAPDVHRRHHHVRLCERGILEHMTQVGTREGGAFEIVLLAVYEWDAQGRLQTVDNYDVDQVEPAQARFDEIRTTTTAPESFANAASRADRALIRCFNERDWPGVEACVAVDLVFDERRRLLRNTCGREVWLEQFRMMFDVPASRFTSVLHATRGERLSLNLHRFEGNVADGGGPLAMDDHYALHEVDREGRIVAIVLFDQNDLDVAHAELDARFDAGEGMAHAGTLAAWRRDEDAMAIQDWDALSAARSPGAVLRDHRLLGWGTPTIDTAVRMMKSLYDLAQDVRRRHDHVRLCERGILEHMTQVGTRDGGAFEHVLLAVYEWDAQGRRQATDNYDVDRFDLARARFEEIEHATPQPLFANAASRLVERGVGRLWAARDWDGIVAQISPAMRMNDRRRIMRLEIGYEEFVAQFRMLFEQPRSRWRESLLATRGERLSLHRTLFEAEVAEGGGELAFEEHLSLTEVDADGRWIASVTFDLEDEEAAHAELDARFEAGEHKDHSGSLTVMREFARAIATRDWAPMLALCSPALVEHDHRPLAVLGTTRGAEAWVQNFRVLADLAPDSRYRVEHFRASARGICSVGTWVGTREGGPYEIPLVAVIELDAQARIARADIFDADQLERARARFDELGAKAVPARAGFENAATRNVERATAAQGSRDSEGFGACFANEFRNIDRRPLMQLDLDREQFLGGYRQVNEMTTSRPTHDVLATRGDRMALVRVGWRGAEGDVGPSEIDWLLVIEVNERGETVVSVTYDSHALDAAYAELDARFDAGEAAAHRLAAAWLGGYLRCFAARDWAGLRALFAPELVGHNHRLVGWGTLQGPAALVSTLEAQVGLAPDTRERVDHVRICQRGLLFEYAWLGTHEGGAFENVWIVAAELDALGRAIRVDVWEDERVALALARFEEIRNEPAPQPGRFENVASRAWREVCEAWTQRDVARFAQLHPPALRYRDHRHMLQLDLDREQFLEFSRPLLELRTGDQALDLLATRGMRLALFRHTMEMAGDEVGPSAIDSLMVVETAETDDIVAYERFDVDALDPARAELDARWLAGEGAQHSRASTWVRDFAATQKAPDPAALTAFLVPAFVARDHRLVGWGTLHGPVAFLETVRTLNELAPDVSLRVDHTRATNRGILSDGAWVGTRDGGAFESPLISVVELDADGRAVFLDLYDPRHRDAALARFEEIRAKASAVSSAMERWNATFEIAFATDDWGPMRALCVPQFCFDDRRRLARVSGGLELMIASARERAAIGARPQMVAIDNAGDRVAIMRTLWSGGPEDGRFEIEYLAVVELDASGLLSAFIFIDVDDVRTAQREAWARWAAIDPSTAAVTSALGEMIDGFNAGRPMTALFPDELVVEDHRRTGMGRLAGLGAYAESIDALRDLAPDSTIEAGWQWLAIEPHGALTVMRRTGTLREGGAYETEHLFLLTLERGRVARLEFFELEDAEAALARFAELRPDPSRIPPNAATRANDRGALAIDAGDRAAMRALVTRDFRFEDRGKRALVVGDVNMMLDSVLFLASELRARREPELLATIGDRIAVYRDAWSGTAGRGDFELDKFLAIEVDDEGKSRALLIFDAEDRAAAFAEALARFATGEAAGCVAVRVLTEFLRAINARDWDALRETYTADFALTDRRPLGLGVLDLEAWIASLRASVELSVGLAFEVVQVLAWSERGVVVKLRRHGSMPDGGGPFENFPICVALNRGDRIARYELFDETDLERALTRFAELCASIAP